MIDEKVFQSSFERLKNEAQERQHLSSRLLPYGIDYLDKALRGILPDELVLIGAYSGAGKTELATHIAKVNSLYGRKVHFFALEAANNEIERRIKFQKISRDYYKSGGVDELNYRSWYLGDYDSFLPPIDDEYMERFKNLNTYYRDGSFDVNDFKKMVLPLRDSSLVIVDHIHYFDYDTKEENIAVGETIKAIRDLVLHKKVPVILIAHLRKRNKMDGQIVPDQDEFHGTSNLNKIATTIITMAREEISVDENSHKRFQGTLVKVAKNRMGGDVTNYVGRLYFDPSTNGFRKKFHVGVLKNGGKKFHLLNREDGLVPGWLK